MKYIEIIAILKDLPILNFCIGMRIKYNIKVNKRRQHDNNTVFDTLTIVYSSFIEFKYKHEPPIPIKVFSMGPAKQALIAIVGYPICATEKFATKSPKLLPIDSIVNPIISSDIFKITPNACLVSILLKY